MVPFPLQVLRVVACTVLIAATLPASAHSQVGVTTDILTGIVVDDQGNPLAGVVVEALSLESEITRSTTTDSHGRYTILFPDGGGQYRMTARMLGMMPQLATMIRHADEDRLVWDVQLASAAFALDPVVVTGQRRPIQTRNPPTPGSVQRNFTPEMLARLPLDVDDLNLLAALVPGVVGVDATDSTSTSFSVAGQRPDANALTLDGMTFSAGQLPQEGLRNTRVITNTYDVSRGRFSGGIIASTSRGGTNAAQGSLTYSLRSEALAFSGGESSPFTAGVTQHVIGGGLGGPIVNNRLFVYGSGQVRVRRNPITSLTTATSADLERLGVAPDSVDRFTTIVDALGAAPESRIAGNRSNDVLSALLRVDYLMSNDHTLTFRGDVRGIGQEPSRLPPSALPETSGENETSGGGMMASLASRVGPRLINEARAYASISRRSGNPYQFAPQGRVNVASDLSDGSVGISTLVMGGSNSMPTSSDTRSLEITDELSWLPGVAEHRLKVGGFLRVERSSDLVSQNQFGTYTYNSLSELETAQPAAFRRTLTSRERESTALEFAAYVGDVWFASRGLQVNYGLRFEGSSFRNPPEYNPALDSTLGVRTDRLPSEFDVSPRIGFTWSLGGSGFGSPPIFILRGGIGKFRSPMPAQLVAQTQTSTGLSDAQSILNCTGAAVPIPDWSLYGDDAGAIPDVCNGAGAPAPQRTQAPNATVFSSAYGAPKAWRASFGVQRNLTTLLRFNVNANYARGMSQYGFRDLNLRTEGGFTLAAENDRPVFVAAGQIVPSTGAVNFLDSRIDSTFAQVLEIDSHLASETKQLTISLGGVTRNGVVLQTAYTWSSVRDQSSQTVRGGGRSGRIGGTTTSGNPNLPEWGRSSFERKHSFLLTVSYPFGSSLEVTAIGRLTSGVPYTPRVAGDINGDGASNDQAFIIDPAASPAMANLLANTSSGARSCLERQIGRIAERNSCLGPWEGALDFQINYRPNFLGMNRQVQISITTMNFLRGVDELLHGADGARGWGLRARPDATLLFVDGFDPVQQQFIYSVNERFGTSDPQRTALRAPFQLGIQVRAFFGPNRGRAALDRLRGAGDGRAGGRGGGFGPGLGRGGGGGGGRGGGLGARGITGEDFLDRFQSLLINPASLVLERRDSLELNDEQVARLTSLRDSLTVENEAVASALQQEIDALGDNPDPRDLIQLIRPKVQEARTNARRNLDAIRATLTGEQWDMLPDALKEAGRGR